MKRERKRMVKEGKGKVEKGKGMGKEGRIDKKMRKQGGIGEKEMDGKEG